MNSSGDKGSTSPRPPRVRVVHPNVQEVLKGHRRGRGSRRSRHDEDDDGGGGGLVRYCCAFQEEGGREFTAPELVWGKVRSHPWWPGQVIDPADASAFALRHARPGSHLVAYFWDRTFAWKDGSTLELLPFRANFARLSTQSTMSSFVSAVDDALQEVARRVEAGLSCACVATTTVKRQEIGNSGVREGADGAVVDTAYMRDAFRARAFLRYIAALGRNPLAGVDSLDLATAKAQLRAFNRSRGPRDLPEFVEGIEDVAEAIPHKKRKTMEKSGGDDVQSKKKKTRRGESSSREKESQPEAASKEVIGVDGSLLGSAATEDTLVKEKKSTHRGSSAKKKNGTCKDTDGLEAVDASKMATKKVMDKSNSGSRLRDTRKKEEALEGLKALGKVGGVEIIKGGEKNNALLKENTLGRRAGSARKKDKIIVDGDELGDGSAKDSDSPGKEMSGCDEISGTKNGTISQHGRKKKKKKKKLSELMAVTPNSAPGRDRVARGKLSVHASTEKLEDPDHDLNDAMTSGKRMKLSTLRDLSSQSQPASPKTSTKAGELMHKAAGQMSQIPPVFTANGASSQRESLRTKDRHVTISHVDEEVPENVASTEPTPPEQPLADDMQDPEKVASTEPAPSEQPLADHMQDPEKVASTEPAPSEQPLADHMKDDYWADILINTEEPLSSLKKKKDKGRSKTSKTAQRVKELSVGGKQDSENGKQPKAETIFSARNAAELNGGTKKAEEMETSVLSGLVLHFSKPSAVPSSHDLIKIFSRYGPVNKAKSSTNANCAQVIFERRRGAEAAFACAGKISALGTALVSFRLADFPAAAGNEAQQVAPKSA